MTPNERLIRSLHAGNREAWNRARVNKLCAMMNVPMGELAAHLDMSKTEFEREISKSNWSGPTCILLTHYENVAKQRLLGTTKTP